MPDWTRIVALTDTDEAHRLLGILSIQGYLLALSEIHESLEVLYADDNRDSSYYEPLELLLLKTEESIKEAQTVLANLKEEELWLTKRECRKT